MGNCASAHLESNAAGATRAGVGCNRAVQSAKNEDRVESSNLQTAPSSTSAADVAIIISLPRATAAAPSAAQQSAANLLQLGVDVMPMCVTICNTEDLQVVYQNHGSLAYAGDQRGVSQLSGASHSFLMQLLSLQPPEMVEEVMAALDKGEGPWVRVIQVPPSLAALLAEADPQPPTADGSQHPQASPRAAINTESRGTFASASDKRSLSLDTSSVTFAAIDFGMTTALTTCGETDALDIIVSKPSLTSPADEAINASQPIKARRPPRKQESSSWLAQQLSPTNAVQPQSKIRFSEETLPTSPSTQDGLPAEQAAGNGTPRGPRHNNGYAGLAVSAGGSSKPVSLDIERSLGSAVAGSTMNTRNRLATLLRTKTDDLDKVAVEMITAPETDKPSQADGTAPEASGLSASKQKKCWHEVTITPFTNAETGQKVFIVAQADVTTRCELEQRLMQVTEAQLFMLESMFPRHVIERIAQMGTDDQAPDTESQPEGAPKMATLYKEMTQATHHHECVTIMFTDICGFTTMSERVEPQQVMTFLNSLFSKFDELVIKHKVSKVETAGDCFIIVGGLMEEDDDGFTALANNQSVSHARAAKRALNFAAEMLHVSSTFTMPDGQPVRQRAGLHTGPVVSGMIGNLLPKFSLFGDTMNTASRMESTSIPGRIQVSEATHKLLQDAPECWECTGGVEVKGKGLMNTYLLTEAAMKRPVQCAVDTDRVDTVETPAWTFNKRHDRLKENVVGRNTFSIDLGPGGQPPRKPFPNMKSLSRLPSSRYANRPAATSRYAPLAEVDEPTEAATSQTSTMQYNPWSTSMQSRFSAAANPDMVEITATLPRPAVFDLLATGGGSVHRAGHMNSMFDSLMDVQSRMGMLLGALMSSNGGVSGTGSQGGAHASGAHASGAYAGGGPHSNGSQAGTVHQQFL